MHTFAPPNKLNYISMNKLRFLFSLFFLLISSFINVNGQFAITYPSAAQDISVCNGQSLLRVRVQINAVSSNNTVTLALPNGVSIVGGSQTLISSAGITGINFASGTAQNPTFSLSPTNLAIGNFIEFTVLRNADCIARTSALAGGSFKDAVTVSGTAGTLSENSTVVNAYNVIYPSLSITSPSPINTGLPGTTYSEVISISNGGNGCLSTLYFYTVSPSGSIQQLSLTIGGVAVPVSSTVGDTVFYAVSGTMLSADGLLCNGEQVVFTQQVKFVNCLANPKYGAGFGCTGGFNGSCQKVLGAAVINGASGTPLFTVTSTTPSPVNRTMCTGWRTVVGLGNTGTGGSGANMYNVQVIYGMDFYSTLTTYVQNDGYYYNLTNWQIASTPAIITFTGPINSQTGNINTSQFLTDPDGAGGLSDLDGDGQFDDLASGQSILVSVFETPVCTATCGDVQWPSSGPVCNLSWNNVCGLPEISIPKRNFSDYFYGTSPNTTITIPPNVFSGTPFNVQVCLGLSDFNWPNTGGFRFEYRFILPPGVSVSGNATWNGGASTYTQVGNEVTILGPIGGGATCVSIDLVVNCVGPTQALNIGLDIDYINDVVSNCNCRKDFVCSSINTTAICISNCVSGPALSYVEAKRTPGSMGYTDHTRTTRRLQSAVSATQERSQVILSVLHQKLFKNQMIMICFLNLLLIKERVFTNLRLSAQKLNITEQVFYYYPPLVFLFRTQLPQQPFQTL
jgi:hypothetical protein